MRTYIKAENVINKLSDLKEDNLDENFNYIWNVLPNEMEEFSYEELVDNNYEINELVITYLMEEIKKYFSKKGLKLNYSYDEATSLAGCAAYDEENNRILLSVIGLMLRAINTTSYIQSICHEITHQIQHKFYKEDSISEIIKYDPSEILVLKHHIYEENHPEDNRKFYKDNYYKLYPEVDAEENGIRLTKEIINNLLIDESLKRQLSEELEEIKEELKNERKVSLHPSEELYNPKEEIRTYFKTPNKRQDSLILVDTYLKKHPELQNKYKVLKLIFNENEPKSYEEIILDRDLLLDEYKDTPYLSNIIGLYNNIIKSDPILQINDYLYRREFKRLDEFLFHHPTLTSYYHDEINKIIEKFSSKEKA